MAVKDYDTSGAYCGPLTNSTEKLYKKAQKAAEKNTWAQYMAGQVPGGGAWGEDGRVGAFHASIDYMKSHQPNLAQEIKVNPGSD